MDALEIARAHVVGNSMGGRIAIEMGLTAPDRVRALGLLCPAVAWVKRGFHPLVRLLRPEFGLLPHGFSRRAVASQFWSMFYDRDLIDPEVGELMVDEFRRIYHSPGARLAFLASARNIYLEAALRSQRVLSPAGRAEPPGAVRLGHARPARPRGIRSPRPALAAPSRAGHDPVLRPRAPGGAARGDQRAADGLLRPSGARARLGRASSSGSRSRPGHASGVGSVDGRHRGRRPVRLARTFRQRRIGERRLGKRGAGTWNV